MENILADLAHHAERFQAHVETAKSNDVTQEDKENAFFNAQVQVAGMQNKFQDLLHHASLELNEILRGFGIDWIKKNTKPNENPDAVKVETAATPETSEPVQPTPQPQFLGDVPTQVEAQPQVQEATVSTPEQEAQQTTP